MSAESLILTAAQEAMKTDEQLLLFYGAEMEKMDRSTPAGEYTGERFFVRRPEAYKLCVLMCADPTISTRQICKLLHITDGTVNGVREREETLVNGERHRLNRKLSHAIERAVERTHEDMPNASALQAATAMGILVDKRALLEGAPTIRIDVTSAGGGNALIERMQALYERLREKNAALPVAATLLDGEEEECSTSNPEELSGQAVQRPTLDLEALPA